MTLKIILKILIRAFPTKKCWYDKDHGIYEKIGIFLFEIEPINDTVDDYVWVIVGDGHLFIWTKA